MYDLWYALVRSVDDEVRTLRRLVHLVDTSNASELPAARPRIHALPIIGLAVLKRCCDVDRVEVAASARGVDNGLFDRVARGFAWGDGCCDDGGTGASKLC